MTLSGVTLHYFQFKEKPSTSGFGENLNLLLKDAGVDFEYVRHDYVGWDNVKADFNKDRNLPHGTLPMVEIDGKSYNKTVPTMRYISKKLGKYLGADDEEEYLLECVADMVYDHFVRYSHVFRCGDQEKLDEHFEKVTKVALQVYDKVYGTKEGPYILGDEISYSDFLVYHILDQDSNTLSDHYDLIQKEHPNLYRFIEAFIQRPRLASYLSSLKSEK